MTAFLGWLAGFGLTLVVEGPIVLLGFAALGWLRPVPAGREPAPTGVRRRAVVLAVLGVNLLTHPVLWEVSRRWVTVGDLLGSELDVVLVEGTLLAVLLRPGPGRPAWWRDLGRTLLVALVANAASVLAGIALH